jgi:Family of unknown function (DUF6387)
MRRIKSHELPEWFNLTKYQRSVDLDLRGWHLNLVPRMILCDLLREKEKYWAQLQEYFEERISGADALIVFENGICSPDEQITPKNNSESAESRLTQATVRSLPASHCVWAITQALNVNSDLSESLLSASKKVWGIDHPVGGEVLDDATNEFLGQSIDLLERTDEQLEDQYLHLEVDMFAPDDMIIDDFRKWLKAARENFDLPAKPLFTPAQINKWSKNQILPFIDLTIWADLQSVKIPNAVMGNALFPGEFDVSLPDRIAKVVRPMAKRLTRMSVVAAMESPSSKEE